MRRLTVTLNSYIWYWSSQTNIMDMHYYILKEMITPNLSHLKPVTLKIRIHIFPSNICYHHRKTARVTRIYLPVSYLSLLLYINIYDNSLPVYLSPSVIYRLIRAFFIVLPLIIPPMTTQKKISNWKTPGFLFTPVSNTLLNINWNIKSKANSFSHDAIY